MYFIHHKLKYDNIQRQITTWSFVQWFQYIYHFIIWYQVLSRPWLAFVSFWWMNSRSWSFIRYLTHVVNIIMYFNGIPSLYIKSNIKSFPTQNRVGMDNYLTEKHIKHGLRIDKNCSALPQASVWHIIQHTYMAKMCANTVQHKVNEYKLNFYLTFLSKLSQYTHQGHISMYFSLIIFETVFSSPKQNAFMILMCHILEYIGWFMCSINIFLNWWCSTEKWR